LRNDYVSRAGINEEVDWLTIDATGEGVMSLSVLAQSDGGHTCLLDAFGVSIGIVTILFNVAKP
jgi:hypothetical protein